MSPSLRALLSGIIDYAGLFPPANLSLHEAVQNYARYRQSPESWMLGRFICPAARLEELGPFLDELLESGPPPALSVLGSGGQGRGDFLKGLRSDLKAISAFLDSFGQQAKVDMMELRLPRDVLQPHEEVPRHPDLYDLCCEVAERITTLPLPINFPYYYEAELGPHWRAWLPSVVEAVGALHKSNYPLRLTGWKLRCGGLEPSAFPSSEQVAFTILTCLRERVPLKFTAGLHHPFRQFDAGAQTPMHGFLNVFGAGVLTRGWWPGEDELLGIIENEDPASFVFDEAGFRWKDFHATTAKITEARQRAVISFGSCSFDEPVADLRAMGLLP